MSIVNLHKRSFEKRHVVSADSAFTLWRERERVCEREAERERG